MTLHLIVDLVNSVPTPTPTPTPSPSPVPGGGGGATTPSSTPAWAPCLTLIAADAGGRVAGLAAVRN